MIDASEAPARIGLCTDPRHYGEFYVPLNPREKPICPDGTCNAPLIVFERTDPLEPMPEGGWKAGERVLVDERWSGVILPIPTPKPDLWAVQFAHPRYGTEYISELRIHRDRRDRSDRRGA